MIFKKTVIALIVLLLFSQSACRINSIHLQTAQDELYTKISKILNDRIESGASIGIKGILYGNKHTQLSEKIESSLSSYFTSNDNFAVYGRSKLMDHVKDELKEGVTDFYRDQFDAIPLGQFKSVEVLITGKITVDSDDAVVAITVVAMDVATGLQIAYVEVKVPKSEVNGFLDLSNEQIAIDKALVKREKDVEADKIRKEILKIKIHRCKKKCQHQQHHLIDRCTKLCDSTPLF